MSKNQKKIISFFASNIVFSLAVAPVVGLFYLSGWDIGRANLPCGSKVTDIVNSSGILFRVNAECYGLFIKTNYFNDPNLSWVFAILILFIFSLSVSPLIKLFDLSPREVFVNRVRFVVIWTVCSIFVIGALYLTGWSFDARTWTICEADIARYFNTDESLIRRSFSGGAGECVQFPSPISFQPKFLDSQVLSWFAFGLAVFQSIRASIFAMNVMQSLPIALTYFLFARLLLPYRVSHEGAEARGEDALPGY